MAEKGAIDNIRIQSKIFLGNILHGYVIEAITEEEAMQKVINRLPYLEIMHEFSVEKHVPEW